MTHSQTVLGTHGRTSNEGRDDDPVRRTRQQISLLCRQSSFTTGEVAELLGCSQQTVIRMADRLEIPSFKVPGSTHRRFTRESVIGYAKQHRLPLESMANLSPIVALLDLSGDVPAVLELADQAVQSFQGQLRTFYASEQCGFSATAASPFCLAAVVLVGESIGSLEREVTVMSELARQRAIAPLLLVLPASALDIGSQYTVGAHSPVRITSTESVSSNLHQLLTLLDEIARL